MSLAFSAAIINFIYVFVYCSCSSYIHRVYEISPPVVYLLYYVLKLQSLSLGSCFPLNKKQNYNIKGS